MLASYPISEPPDIRDVPKPYPLMETGVTFAGAIVFLCLSAVGIIAVCRHRHGRTRGGPHVPDEEHRTTTPVCPPWEPFGLQPPPTGPETQGIRTEDDLFPHSLPTIPKCTVLAQHTGETRPGEYMNPAGEPWVKVPPPKIPLPPRPNTPGTLRSASTSRLCLARDQHFIPRSSSLPRLPRPQPVHIGNAYINTL